MARGGYTIAERLAQFGDSVGERLKPSFEAAGAKYPPDDLAFVAFKDSKRMELYGKDAGRPWRLIKTYPVLAASGKPGPKLREGDHQVPEGVYRLESLNPNSRFHLSVRVSYPNEFDRRMAEAEGRTNLGGDIMIHGSAVSVGCLAIGDEAAEEVLVLAGLVGKERVKVIISPTDFRGAAEGLATSGLPAEGLGAIPQALSSQPASSQPVTPQPVNPQPPGVTAAISHDAPRWVPALYEAIRDELRHFGK